MLTDNTRNTEEFWIDMIRRSVEEGETMICVPLACLGRETAVKLAMRLDIMVFIKGFDYLFCTTTEATQTLLNGKQTFD